MGGAGAGAIAALVWRATDPALKRAFDTPYADAEVLGPFITRGALEPLASTVAHVGVGAVFGTVFARAGGRGVRQGLAAALAENALLWPLQSIVDRFHPYRRDGTWPPIMRNGRVFAQSTAGHAVFGVVLGLLLREPEPPSAPRLH